MGRCHWDTGRAIGKEGARGRGHPRARSFPSPSPSHWGSSEHRNRAALGALPGALSDGVGRHVFYLTLHSTEVEGELEGVRMMELSLCAA